MVFHRWLIALLVLAAAVGVAAGVVFADGEAPGGSEPDPPSPGAEAPPAEPPPDSAREQRRRARGALGGIGWRKSRALGAHEAGKLERGVLLPYEGVTYFTWHPIHKRKPNPSWRRWGTDVLIRRTLRVLREFARAHPRAARVGIGDLSREHGGDFGPEVSGGLGHASHQNGLDVDVYYPLRSRRERAPRNVGEIDMKFAQELVDRFVAAGAVKVFVGPETPLRGPKDVVVPLVHHDNHLHARFAP